MWILNKRTLAFYLLFLGLLILSCSKSSTKVEDSPVLTGTWDISKMTWSDGGTVGTYTQSQLESLGLIWTLKFEENGSALQTTNLSGDLINMPGSWETDSGTLKLILTAPTGETGIMEYEYVLLENLLKLNWQFPAGTTYGAEFSRQ